VLRGYLSEIFVSFQGEGLYAGRRHLFLRFAGCHLRCRYCDTPGSLERTPSLRVYPDGQPVLEGRNPLTCDEVLAHGMAVLDAAGGADGLAITGGEPLLQADFLSELLADARWPRPRILETSGTQPDKLLHVLPVVDAVSMDIKLPSNSGEPAFWDAHARFLVAARGKAYVKILVDEKTTLEDVERAAALVGSESPTSPVFLQPITSPAGDIDLRAPTLARFFHAIRRYAVDVRVLPQTHKMLRIQ
jgi:organic radical activating enzyme